MSTSWSSGAFTQRYLPILRDETAFDVLVEKLGLAGKPEEWEHSIRLKAFAKAHANSRYIPELLLSRWGIKVRVYDTM